MSVAITTPRDLSAPVQVPTIDDIKKNPELAVTLAHEAEHYRRTALDIRSEKVRTLGRGECFVRTSADGKHLQALSANVPVSAAQNHIYQVPGPRDAAPTWRLTASGYDYLNRVAGVQLFTPPTVEVHGERHANPYIERHTAAGKEGVLVAVHAAVTAIGRAATGNLIARTAKLRWAPQSYLATALLTCAYKNPNDACSMIASEFEAEREAGKRPGWIFIPVEQVGDDFVGVGANVRNADVAKQLRAHTERQKFGERIATTICSRIAIAKVLGVSTVVPQPVHDGNGQVTDMVAYVPIIAWAEPDSMLLRSDAAVKTLSEGQPVEGLEHRVLDAEDDEATEDPTDVPEELHAAAAGQEIVDEAPAKAASPKAEEAPARQNSRGKAKPEPAKPNGNGKAETGPLFGGAPTGRWEADEAIRRMQPNETGDGHNREPGED